MIDLPEDYFKIEPSMIEAQRYFEKLREEVRRQVAEKTVALAAKHFPYERQWPEIVYEDILDAEVLDD